MPAGAVKLPFFAMPKSPTTLWLAAVVVTPVAVSVVAEVPLLTLEASMGLELSMP